MNAVLPDTLRVPSSSPWASRAAFFAGLLIPFSVNLVGALPLGEFVLLAAVGLLVGRMCFEHTLPQGLIRHKLLWFFLACQAIALSSYIVSDLLRDSKVQDMIRGWSRMGFLAVDIVAFAYLFGASQSAFLRAQIGATLGGILYFLWAGALFDDHWKFGYGGPVTFLVFIFAPRLGFWPGIVAISLLGMVHFAWDFRSMGGICCVAALLLAVQRLPQYLRPLILVPSLLLGAVAIFSVSRASGPEGGRSDRSTVERTAMLTAAWECFRGSPLIGQGSWFSNSTMLDNFTTLRAEAAQIAGVHGFAPDSEEENLAIHSQLLVSVSEGGVLGGTFFIFFGIGLVWALLHITLSREFDENSAIYLLVLLLSLWNLFLSPFSGGHRILIGISCALILKLNGERMARRGGLAATDSSESEEPKLLAANLIS